jgi:hypothetical protein
MQGPGNFHSKGHSMSFFELSVFDLALTAAVVIIVVFFVFILLKLNPSTQKDKVYDEKASEESTVTGGTLHMPRSELDPQRIQQQDTSPITWKNQQDIVLQKPQQSLSQVVVNTSVGGSEQNLEPVQLQSPIPKMHDEKSCPHEFGYLRGLPKNKSIPEECFGCQKIVDCLRNKKTAKKVA